MAKKNEVKSTSKSVRQLTDKQKRFIEEYLIDLNATQAAIRAGYSKKTAMEQGHQLLQKTSVQNAIQLAQNKRSKRVEITQDDVINGLMLEATREGEGSSHSARVGAWSLLGKHLGMFKDRVDITSDDKPLPTAINIVFGNEREDD